MRQPIDQILEQAQPSTALVAQRSMLGFRMSRRGHIGAGTALATSAFAFAMLSTLGGAAAMFILPALLVGFVSLPFFAAAVALTPAQAPPDGVKPVDRVRADHIRAVMQRNGGKPSVEQIANHLQWSIPAVAAGLRVLVDARELIEDVDLETGEYMYYLTSSITPESVADDLEKRIAQAAAAAGISADELAGPQAPPSVQQVQQANVQHEAAAQMWRR
jgi:uncharacterized protein YneF (UPF0154 family)